MLKNLKIKKRNNKKLQNSSFVISTFKKRMFRSL
jgi:hypothetical protein